MNERQNRSAVAAPIFPALDPAHVALFLDIDGTLLDIAPRPDAVRVPGRLPFDLAAMTGCLGGALALVSGRPLSVIDALFSPVGLPAIGCHGAEIRASTGDGALVTRAAPLPDAFRARLAALVTLHEGLLAEDKLYSVALHYRGVPACEAALLAAVREICVEAPTAAVSVLRGKCVIEVKATGFSKGTALRALMRDAPFHGRIPVFIGDDRTDEDAFAVLPEYGGSGIAVGRALAGAAFVIKDPAAVRDWLAEQVRSKECSV
jgi:trehalose 6-phosphate phosphatase